MEVLLLRQARGGVEGGQERLMDRKVVSFTEDVPSQKQTHDAPLPRGTLSNGSSNGHREHSDTFPWLAILAALLLVCIGASMVYCSRRRSDIKELEMQRES